MKPTNSVYTGLPTTIFEEMCRLAIAHRAVNLGQGFPDVDGPEDIRRKAAEALIDGPNQYPPMLGVMALREAVAANWKRFHGLDVDPVTRGAGHLRRHRGALRRDQRADRAGRRGGADRAALRLLSAAGEAGRGHAAARARDAARLGARRGGARRRLLAADQGAAPQQPAEPGGQGLFARRAAAASPSSSSATTPTSSPTRSTSTSSSTARGTSRCCRFRACASGRSQSARPARASRFTGWKVGYVDRRAGAARSDRQGAPVHHLHHAARPAEGGRLRPRQGRELFQRAGGRTSAEARSPGECLRARSASDVIPCQGTYFLTARHARRSAWRATTRRSPAG